MPVRPKRDPCLDTLLDLNGQVMVLDENGDYWVEFKVRLVPVTRERPHGLNYSLTLHGKTTSDWSVLTTHTRSGKHEVRQARRLPPSITGTDCAPSDRMNIVTLPHYSTTSGVTWTGP